MAGSTTLKNKPWWLPQSLALSVLYECERIAKKGWWLIMAIVSNIIAISLFKMIADRYWPAFVDHYGSNPLTYVLVLSGSTWISHSLNMLFYCLIEYFGLFSKYRVNKKSIWQLDPVGWPKLRNRSILLNFINVYIVGTSLAYISTLIKTQVPIERLRQVPPTSEILWQLFFCICVESSLFFIMHIVGHKYLYRFHKVHHEFTIPHALAAIHSDPIDYIIGTLLPLAGGYIILGKRMHFLSLYYWTIWRQCEGFSNHCNYDFDWSLFRIVPFSAGSSYHSFHHTHNIGNFGSFMAIHDTITQTNQDYYQHIHSKHIRQ